MNSWSKRRKIIIASVMVIAVICFVGIPAFFLFYKAPTCFDGIKNGSELGVDCGGKCTRLCQNVFAAPVVDWTRFEEVAPGLYNLATYIENPNTEGEAIDVPYSMSVYGDKGMLIVVKNGKVTLPPHRNTIAFMSTISVGNSKPVKTVFEFTSAPDWHKSADSLASLKVTDKKYTEDSAGSSLSVKLGNSSVLPIDKISVYSVLYDKDGNALGFSKTYVDEIPANGEAIAPFTWAINRNNKVISIEVLPVAE